VLPISSHEREFEVPAFVGACTVCGDQTIKNGIARYAYGTYAGFFGLLKRIEIYGTCSKCEDEVLIPEAEVPDSIREQIPFMHRKGILLLPLVIVALMAILAILGAF
jgi:hypothetical protein